MADIKEIAKDLALTALTGPVGRTASAIKKLIKEYKEKKAKAKDKKLKDDFQKMIDDLKSEIKLSKGDRGAAEDMPKKKAEENIFSERIRKRMKRAVPTFFGHTPPKQSKGPTGMTQQEMRRRTKGKFDMKTGGTVSKYSKGGGVRSSKYKL